MCYQYPKMVLNLPAFLRSLVNKTKDEKNQPVFNYWELDDIICAATSKEIPILSAKRWGISNHKNGLVYEGKN